MNEAASLLIGKQDFASFAKLHSDVKNTICEITHAQWEIKNDTLVFEICANRFLRNMVRAIVGTLLEVGQNKMSANEFKKVIAQQDRQAAALSVPAHGLFLWKIEY
jgi:tRNA pseudouridine38-40 synthase